MGVVSSIADIFFHFAPAAAPLGENYMTAAPRSTENLIFGRGPIRFLHVQLDRAHSSLKSWIQMGNPG